MSAELVLYRLGCERADHARPRTRQRAEHAIDRRLAGSAGKGERRWGTRGDHLQRAQRCFVPGLDLDIVRGKRGTETKLFLERLYFALNDVQYRMGKPTIAAVDGPARAGDDRDIVRHDHCRRSRNVRLSGNRCRIDSGPAFCASAAPCRQASGVWPAVSRRFVRCRDRVSHGLISEVVPKGTALDRARTLARRIAEKSPIVMKIGRDAFIRAVDADYRRAIENVAESFALVATTPGLPGRP